MSSIEEKRAQIDQSSDPNGRFRPETNPREAKSAREGKSTRAQ